jgi:hypothetical protein
MDRGHGFHPHENATSDAPSSLLAQSSGAERGDDMRRYPSQVVLLYLAGILQSGCGYYIPMSALFLWRSIGIGAFIMGLVYLQYLYSSYFFFDGPVAAEVSRLVMEQRHALVRGDGGGWRNPYPTEAQDFASFFFVLFAHFTVYRTWSESAWRATVIITAFFVYIGGMAWSYGFDSKLLVVATLIGAALGMTKVLFFDAIMCPLLTRLCNIGFKAKECTLLE